MTADIATQRKRISPSTMLHTLTLAFAALTLLFALLSMILGNRLSTLQTNYLKAEKESATSNAASIQEMETARDTAMVTLETARQALDAEKAAVERLRGQLSAVMKDLENTKTDLARANQTITGLKSTVPVEPTPSVETSEPITSPLMAPSSETVLSQDPPPQPAPQ